MSILHILGAIGALVASGYIGFYFGFQRGFVRGWQQCEEFAADFIMRLSE